MSHSGVGCVAESAARRCLISLTTNARRCSWDLDKREYITLLNQYDQHRDPSSRAGFIEVRPLRDRGGRSGAKKRDQKPLTGPRIGPLAPVPAGTLDP